MSARAEYPPLQFAGFRIALGVYLAVHFSLIALYAGELLSAEGLVPDVRLNTRHFFFPDVLLIVRSPLAATLFAVVAVVAAMFLAVGLIRHMAAPVLWYALACVAHRNTLFPDPSTPFTGWLVLATMLVPAGEPLTVRNRSRHPVLGWQFPRAVFVATWAVLGVSYSASGLIKLGTPEWLDGRAFGLFIANALHRDNVVWSTLSALPAAPLTRMGLGTELLAGPLALLRWTRPVGWIALVSLHLVVLGTMRTSMLSLGALLPLVLAFDAGWLAAARRTWPHPARSKKAPESLPGKHGRGGGRKRRRGRMGTPPN